MRSFRTDPAFARNASAVALVMVCLVSVNCRVLLPRQGWNDDWGPLVPHDTFPGDCGICHQAESWNVLRDDFQFDHAEETGYPLQGAHVLASCLRCHNDRGPVRAYLSRGCAGCHVDPHQGSLGIECTRCHNQTTWSPDGIILEHARTGFPLLGTHALTPCESCHKRQSQGDFRGAPRDCHLCHQRAIALASPNHVINNWVTNCDGCHTPESWVNVGFAHGFFPLVGGHAGLACGQCHPGELFVPIPPDCYSCHQADYIRAANHVANNFSTDCTLCHNTTAWN